MSYLYVQKNPAIYSFRFDDHVGSLFTLSIVMNINIFLIHYS